MKTQRRPIPRKCIDLLHQLHHVAFRVPTNVADIFVSFSPHIDVCHVTVHVGGWDALGKEVMYRWNASVNELADLQKIRGEVLALLADIAAGKTIPPQKEEIPWDTDVL